MKKKNQRLMINNQKLITNKFSHSKLMRLSILKTYIKELIKKNLKSLVLLINKT